jgi:hypothetical protein
MGRDTLTFDTLDEAIAEALRGAPAGSVIEIHGEACEGREEPDPPYDVIGCTCMPMVFVAQEASA